MTSSQNDRYRWLIDRAVAGDELSAEEWLEVEQLEAQRREQRMLVLDALPDFVRHAAHAACDE